VGEEVAVRLPGSQPTPKSVRETRPQDIVDAGLVMATRRESFTPDEVLELLHGVQAGVSDGAPDARISGIVADAEVSYARVAGSKHPRKGR
jgi:hypothetical protein